MRDNIIYIDNIADMFIVAHMIPPNTLPVLLLLIGDDIPPGKDMCPFWPAGDVLDEGDFSCQARPGSRASAELGHSSEPWRGW